MGIIGAADEFWRLRITRVDTTDDLDFEWREDILYREPPATHTDEIEVFQVEAVHVDNHDHSVIVARFYDREGAEEYLAEARDDLSAMTRAQFEDAYLGGADDLPPL